MSQSVDGGVVFSLDLLDVVVVVDLGVVLSDSQTSLGLLGLVDDEFLGGDLSVLEVVHLSDQLLFLGQVLLVFWVSSLGLADEFLDAGLLDGVGPLETFGFSVDVAPLQAGISLSQGAELLVWFDFVSSALVQNALIDNFSVRQFLDNDRSVFSGVGSDDFTNDVFSSDGDDFGLTISVLDDDLVLSGINLDIGQFLAGGLLKSDLKIPDQRVFSDLKEIGELVELLNLDGLVCGVDGVVSVDYFAVVFDTGGSGNSGGVVNNFVNSGAGTGRFSDLGVDGFLVDFDSDGFSVNLLGVVNLGGAASVGDNYGVGILSKSLSDILSLGGDIVNNVLDAGFGIDLLSLLGQGQSREQ